MTTIEKTIYTAQDLVIGNLGHGGPGYLGIEYRHAPDGECPDIIEWYEARIELPAGLKLGEGLIVDGVEFISVEHLCGEPCIIE